jgi:hypothetical protein
MDAINDSITTALLQLFRNKSYLPLHPFKLLLQSLLRDEASAGLSQVGVLGQIRLFIYIPWTKSGLVQIC